MRISAIMRPAVSISAAADVIAGYVIAAPAMPRPRETLLTVPLLFGAGALLGAAGEVFSACFTVEAGLTESDRPGSPGVVLARAVEQNRITLKAAFVMGAGLALAGIFAVMAAALTAGHLPVYAACFLFLVGWFGKGGSQVPLVGPLANPAMAGLRRAMTLAMGMCAHAEIVYGQSVYQHGGVLVAAGLYFAYGALAQTLDESLGEGARRYTILACVAGMLLIFGGLILFGRSLFVGRSPGMFVALAGGVFLVVRGLPALRTLVPGAVGRLAEAAQLSGLFLAAALAWGRWPTQGVVLVLGAVPLALVVPCAVLFAREETVPVPASLREREII